MSGACHAIATRGNGSCRKARSAALMLAALALTGLLSVPASAHSAARTAPSPTDLSRPHVYLMRGLLNVFSLGMDQLAAQFKAAASRPTSTITRWPDRWSPNRTRSTAPAIAAPIYWSAIRSAPMR